MRRFRESFNAKPLKNIREKTVGKNLKKFAFSLDLKTVKC